MFNVLLIDDDVFMLKALVRVVKSLRKDWNFILVDDPTTWRSAVSAQSKLDLVISDYIMPEVNGDRVLSEVAELQPQALRVLLTGDISEDVANRVLSNTHFIVAKPFSEIQLETVFRAVEIIAELGIPFDLRKSLCSSLVLAPLPTVIRDIRVALSKEYVDVSAVAEIVERDPVFVARLFQLANSAFLGFNNPTFSLHTAIKRLGFNITSSIVAVESISHAFSYTIDPNLQQKISDKYFNFSLLVRSLSKKLNYSLDIQERLFTCALLSALGELVASTYCCDGNNESSINNLSGHDLHCLLSAAMLALWGYDETIYLTILNSAKPELKSNKSNMSTFLFLVREYCLNDGCLPQDIVEAIDDKDFFAVFSSKIID